MIGKLSGIIEEIHQERVILNVSGVGYLVYTTANFLKNAKLEGSIALYIEQHIYENNIKLYGFSSVQEQEVLKLLVKVNGISHKIAMNLLDSVGYQNIILNIRRKNDSLLKTKGIGEKLTKRIVTEIYDDALKFDLIKDEKSQQDCCAGAEAISALVNLGYNVNIATAVVRNLLEIEPNLATGEIIRKALKEM